jgi:hypothetical protein
MRAEPRTKACCAALSLVVALFVRLPREGARARERHHHLAGGDAAGQVDCRQHQPVRTPGERRTAVHLHAADGRPKLQA